LRKWKKCGSERSEGKKGFGKARDPDTPIPNTQFTRSPAPRKVFISTPIPLCCIPIPVAEKKDCIDRG
jgi:hypothetical protein